MLSASGERNFTLENTSGKMELESDDSDSEGGNKGGLFVPKTSENPICNNNIKLWEIGYPVTLTQQNEENPVATEIQEKIVQSEVSIGEGNETQITEIREITITKTENSASGEGLNQTSIVQESVTQVSETFAHSN